MYSSASISKAVGAVPLLAGLVLFSGGCAVSHHAVTQPKLVHGYANLDALVRRHPGWGGVARYDNALMRLARVGQHAPVTAPPDFGLGGLPSAPEGPLAASIPTLARESKRLETIQRIQLSRLRGRQEQNRLRQIALESQVWRRQAKVQYTQAIKDAQAAYTRHLMLLTEDNDARRLNLTLQIKALQKIVLGWNASTPPTPELNRAKAELGQKQEQLAMVDQDRRHSLALARAGRDTALAAALRMRNAFVSNLADQEDARLRSQDERQAAILQKRLTAQRLDLLADERSLSVAPVPPAGGLGPQSLPSGPNPATVVPGAGHSFRLAQIQLTAQRARWLAFLYSDTRAAALDAATRQHWVVTFDRPVRGERDLTAPLAQALTTRVWKT